jgi:hypothetical protein
LHSYFIGSIPELSKNRDSDMPNLTTSEIMFEHWCGEHNVQFRRIKVARAQGHKRPDYAIKVNGGWCVVEVKEIDPTAEDDRLYQQIASNQVEGRWVDAGARLRKPIRDASDQLRKFSVRGFPTAVCLVDNTVGFYVEPFQVIQAMCGKATVRIAVSNDPEYEARFLGMHHGKKATMTGQHNTSISAVAVLRQPLGSAPFIDLYHNRFARVPIARDSATLIVRAQIEAGTESPEKKGPTLWDLMSDPNFGALLAMSEGEREAYWDREVAACIRELRQHRST